VSDDNKLYSIVVLTTRLDWNDTLLNSLVEAELIDWSQYCRDTG